MSMPDDVSRDVARAGDETDFWSSLAGPEQKRARLALRLALLLYPSFGLLDAVVYRDAVGSLLTIRLVVGLVFGWILFALRRTHPYRNLAALSALGVAAAGIGIAAMIHLLRDPEGPYYAGLCIVFVVSAVWFAWPLALSTGVNAVVLAAYYLPLVGYDRPLDVRLLVSNSFFLWSTALVAMLGVRTRYRLARLEFDARQRLAASMEELQRANKFKDEMFQNVSHELRTPLTLILAPVETFLHRKDLPGEDRKRFASMRRNALRLLALISDLLDLEKLGASSLEADQVPVDLKRQLSRLHEDTRQMAHTRHIELKLVLPDEPVVALLDPRHLERVLLNLLSNALKFTPEGGTVTLGLEFQEGGMVLFVADTGIGISKGAQSRIFERFQQADGGTTRKYGGTGIGLSLVAELTRLMGGAIEVESAEGKGSRFTVRFPENLRLDAAGIAGTSEPPGPPSSEPLNLVRLSREAAYAGLTLATHRDEVCHEGDHGPRIVLAEDDPELNRELVQLLAPHYRVTSVPNGSMALEQAVAEGPDLIVSDVMMPGMDGLELTQALRERPEFRETPIVLLTARGELEDRIRGRSLGADTYLTKPFHPRELVAAIDGLLRARMRLVGSFLVHRPLGAGGQSQVFLAEHVTSGELSALKIVRQEGAIDTEARRRATRERQTLAKLQHSNIVRIVEHGEMDDGVYVAMEYLTGDTLQSLVRTRGPLPAASVRDVGLGVCGALVAVHQAELIHRDIKGSNLVVQSGDGPLRDRIRLIDFGTVLEEKDWKQGEIAGTLPYMAPEIFKGDPPSTASDIYAVGVTLYYAATGRLPFRGDRASIVHAASAPTRPRAFQVVPALDRHLDTIIARAMALTPELRFVSASEMLEALRELDTLGPAELSTPSTKPPNLHDADTVTRNA